MQKGRYLILVTLILVIVPFIVSNILNNYFVTNDYKATIKDNSIMLSRSIVDNVQIFIDKAYSIAFEISNSSDVIDFNSGKQQTEEQNAVVEQVASLSEDQAKELKGKTNIFTV